MLDDFIASLSLILLQTKNNLYIITVLVAILFFCYALIFINPRLLRLGIIPRHIQGLPGIFISPLLHADFNHLFFNLIPLVVLSNFILISGVHYYLIVSFMIMSLSGMIIWCIAKPGIYVGASGVITGYWGFLICNIYQNGTLTTIILGILSLYYFAGIFLGIFPQEKGVSWQGHLCGLLSGIATSYLTNTYSIIQEHL